MSSFARNDRSLLSRWWWTIDRWSVLAIAILMMAGATLMLTVSPATGSRVGLESFQLARQQLALLPIAALVIIFLSLLSTKGVGRIAVLGLVTFITLTAMTLVVGQEIKGAQRWIYLFGFSLQPSEFLKPFFAVVSGWLLAGRRADTGEVVGSDGLVHNPGRAINLGLYLVILLILISQPDIGMAFVVSATWMAQLFHAGLALRWVGLLVVTGVGALFLAYLAVPHVTARIDAFLNPETSDTYQVDRAMAALAEGGIWGAGPGEGRIKAQLPDAHADFIFAVAVEEFGLIACLVLLAIFPFILLRGVLRLTQDTHQFSVLAASGLLVSFSLQAMINMASTLGMIPPKGMTLPFISYGGSSLLAVAVGMGMLLALTRRRPTHGGPS